MKFYLDKIDLKKFKHLKVETETEYKKIGKIFSPALKTNIYFNSNGFHHLRFDGSRKERSKSVQKNKFLFLKSAVKIIKISNTVQEYRRIENKKIIEWFAFYAIISFSKKIRIKVIIRRVGGENGKYHFWSVMPFWALAKKDKIIGAREIEDN